MKKNYFFLLAILFAVASCKKKEDVPTLSEKQRLILGKWQQLEVRNLITGQNEMSPCQVANPTVFEFKTDGKCYASSPGGCFQGTSITPYAISADGSIIVIEDLLYYIETLDNADFVFTYGSRTNPSYRQRWKKIQ